MTASHLELDGNYFNRRQLVLRGVVACVVVGAVASALLAKWSGVFDGQLRIVAELSSAGDGLPSGSDVKYRGVLVGTVDEVTPATEEQANLVHMRLDPHYAASIPATVTARVVPSNVFAVSSLQLVDRGAGRGLRDGDRIDEDTRLPTVLFQTTMSKLRDILAAAGRGRDDNTLGLLAAVGEATHNRRGKLLTSAAQLDRLIDEVNGVLATDPGPSTLSALVGAAEGLAHTAPELLNALHEAVEPMRTFTEKQQQLRTLLTGGATTTSTTVEALTNNTDRLVETTTDLTPVIGVLAQNAHHFVPISRRINRFSDTFFAEAWDAEAAVPRGRVNLSFTPTYTYTRADCPRYGELLGLSCYTAPENPVRPELPDVLLPQNYQPPRELAPPPGTVVGPQGNLVADGPPLVNPEPDLRYRNSPSPPGVPPAPPVPGSAQPSRDGDEKHTAPAQPSP